MKDCETLFLDAAERFNIPGLYPWQQFTVASVADCFNDDVEIRTGAVRNRIVLLPTGAGKSLCFQVPATELPGLTVIVYPLLALMADQEKNLRAAGITPIVLKGGMTPTEYDAQFALLDSGSKIVIANPEILSAEKMVCRLEAYHVAHFVIDEAHCVVTWGDSFRPAYLELSKVIARLRPDTVTAFTATASPDILARMSEVLFNGDAVVMRGDCDRPNLHYRVRSVAARDPALIFEVLNNKRPAVVFCGTRNNAEYTARLLRRTLRSTEIRFYHAGLSRDEKKDVELWFNTSTDGVLTATCAWGMGIDKKDVRTVIHYDIPTSAAAYIQEAGRAGRDGSNVHAVALYSAPLPSDSPMALFVSGTVCRRKSLLDAMTPPELRTDPLEKACSGCDICDGNASNSDDVYTVASFIKKHRFCYTYRTFSAFLLKQLNNNALQKYGILVWEPKDVRDLLETAIKYRAIKMVKIPFLQRFRILY